MPYRGPRPVRLTDRLEPSEPTQPAQKPSPALAPPPSAADLKDALPFLNELRWLINGIVARARLPNGNIRVVTRQEFADFEQALKKLEARWRERELQLAQRELTISSERTSLDIKRRELLAASDRIDAREQLVAATRTPFPSSTGHNPLAQEALEQLRLKLNAQEAAIEKARAEVAERQQFLEQSETVLSRKIQAQDELSALLDQRAEELTLREEALARKEAALRGEAPAPNTTEKA